MNGLYRLAMAFNKFYSVVAFECLTANSKKFFVISKIEFACKPIQCAAICPLKIAGKRSDACSMCFSKFMEFILNISKRSVGNVHWKFIFSSWATRRGQKIFWLILKCCFLFWTELGRGRLMSCNGRIIWPCTVIICKIVEFQAWNLSRKCLKTLKFFSCF